MYESVICWILNHCSYSCNPFPSVVYKTDVLNKAKKCGLTIPEWIITNNKTDLMPFFNKHKDIATKTFTPLWYHEEDCSFKNLTNKVSIDKDLDLIPDTFPETFFQKYIEKKHELRVFYFQGKFYTMAILSQNNDQTEIDFRHYSKENPNRSIPFSLPPFYAKKLDKLSKLLNLQTGSFDILVDYNDAYHFLEVNPVGQFGMVSYPCNYNIERDIAVKLKSLLQNIKK